MSVWIVLRINNSRYQCWQVSVIIWSIVLGISYVSLKSDNITYVEMSYVLALCSNWSCQSKAKKMVGKEQKQIWLGAQFCVIEKYSFGIQCVDKTFAEINHDFHIARFAIFMTFIGHKVHIFWEGHKILRHLHLTFALCIASQK